MQYPIYLIGYMGAGKTTIGRLLADKLGWWFVDLDEAFAEIHGKTPAEYIRTYGLEAFRHKEKYVLEDLADQSPYEKVIYATGGGYPCWEDNMECLKELGTSIYIRWKPEHLAKRLLLTNLSERPLLQNKKEEELVHFIASELVLRAPYYEQADYILDAPLGKQCEADDALLAEKVYSMICQSTKSNKK